MRKGPEVSIGMGNGELGGGMKMEAGYHDSW
jgi:hypothetical protein